MRGAADQLIERLRRAASPPSELVESERELLREAARELAMAPERLLIALDAGVRRADAHEDKAKKLHAEGRGEYAAGDEAAERAIREALTDIRVALDADRADCPYHATCVCREDCAICNTLAAPPTDPNDTPQRDTPKRGTGDSPKAVSSPHPTTERSR